MYFAMHHICVMTGLNVQENRMERENEAVEQEMQEEKRQA